jgi:hypothetical protein
MERDSEMISQFNHDEINLAATGKLSYKDLELELLSGRYTHSLSLTLSLPYLYAPLSRFYNQTKQILMLISTISIPSTH